MWNQFARLGASELHPVAKNKQPALATGFDCPLTRGHELVFCQLHRFELQWRRADHAGAKHQNVFEVMAVSAGAMALISPAA